MHEWNEKDLEAEYPITKPDSNDLVVIHNLVARATTRWSADESKLFLFSLTKIGSRNSENWVTIPKKEIYKALGTDPHNAQALRETFKRTVMKSFVQLDHGQDEFLDGVLLVNLRSTKKEISIQFNSAFMPLLENLSANFTDFYFRSIAGFEHTASIKLYMFLCSWHNPDFAINKRFIAKKDIPTVFGLKEGEYWRNYGQENARFHWADFEKYCLNPAIQEINRSKDCDMFINEVKKDRDGRSVLGYTIAFSFLDETGHFKTKEDYHENLY